MNNTHPTQDPDILFPNECYYAFEPLPWVKISGGMKLLKFEVKYSRDKNKVCISVGFQPPLIENGAIEYVGLSRIFNIDDLLLLEDMREPIMNLVRQVMEHEALESLRVVTETGDKSYFDEVEVLHNNIGSEELEKRLPTNPKMCKKLKSNE